jgi:hypothetical protein
MLLSAGESEKIRCRRIREDSEPLLRDHRNSDESGYNRFFTPGFGVDSHSRAGGNPCFDALDSRLRGNDEWQFLAGTRNCQAIRILMTPGTTSRGHGESIFSGALCLRDSVNAF